MAETTADELARLIRDILTKMVKIDASDLHLKVGNHPVFRVHGGLVADSSFPKMTREMTAAIVDRLVPTSLREKFKRDGAVDFGFSIDTENRLRTNAYTQRGCYSIAMRRLGYHDLEFEQLHLPPVIKTISENKHGMVLLTGPTGCGKSTTMAAIINHINRTKRCHIITIEDPIEFIHPDIGCIIDQREVGIDARAFDEALRHAMREDPNVILIGEMRDQETVNTAIRAAMTGHLILSTVHTISAVQAVNRILKFFPVETHPAIRSDLTLALKAVVTQRLVPGADGRSRVPAVEVMIVNEMIRKLIREDRIEDMIQVIRNRVDGMQTFDQSLLSLAQQNLITSETAIEYAEDPSAVRRNLTGAFVDVDKSSLVGGF
ncbi:PilT/PilU family type 4a pilus ATPase [Candidatus Sumerlaeota bacterium]|nr:PilT/PilU family type 4a pilus ATPase [Candidatus Sumerlaeota bacterium]